MPIPRGQPIRRIPKVKSTPSLLLDRLDDFCLSKIIYYALRFSSGEEEFDNGSTERSLSLVSKRWYFLTQTQVNSCGIHAINLDKIPKQGVTQKPKINEPVNRSVAHAPLARRPRILMPRNHAQQQSSEIPLTENKSTTYDISLVRAIQPKLRKYKHIVISGSLTCDQFRKLILALDAARIEKLSLNLKIERDFTQAKDFAVIPRHLCHLEKLTLLWTNDPKSDFSNALMWTIYERATGLKTLELQLQESTDVSSDREPIEDISDRFLDRKIGSYRDRHMQLQLVSFKRTLADARSFCCIYTSLIHGVLAYEGSVAQVETNDKNLTDYIIKSSDRTCTTLNFRSLKLLSPVEDIGLFEQLLQSGTLGSDNLSVFINNFDQLDEVRYCLESFKPARHLNSVCRLSLHLKDQKVADSEDRIKRVIQLSRLCELIIHVSAQQRVSIDCCHLMWSVGRALQPNEMCLFKIELQFSDTLKIGQTKSELSYSEITIPFGKCQNPKINPSREDLMRHRQIIKSMNRDCYSMFVKSVRDNM